MSSILCWNDGVVNCFGWRKWVLQHIKIIALQSFCCQVCGRERALWFPRGALGGSKGGGRTGKQPSVGMDERVKREKSPWQILAISWSIGAWIHSQWNVWRPGVLLSHYLQLKKSWELRQDFLNWERYNTFAVCSVFVRSEAVYQWMAMLPFWHEGSGKKHIALKLRSRGWIINVSGSRFLPSLWSMVVPTVDK